MKTTECLVRTLLLSSVLIAAGCGGGGGNPDPGSPPVAGGGDPPVQAEPMDKFFAFVKEMVQIALDSAEPVDVSGFDPPTRSDTRESFATQP